MLLTKTTMDTAFSKYIISDNLRIHILANKDTVYITITRHLFKPENIVLKSEIKILRTDIYLRLVNYLYRGGKLEKYIYIETIVSYDTIYRIFKLIETNASDNDYIDYIKSIVEDLNRYDINILKIE